MVGVPLKVSNNIAATRACARPTRLANSRSVVVAEHPVRPCPGRQRGLVGFDERRDGLRLPVRRDQVEVERQVKAGQIRPVIGHQTVDWEVSLPNHHPIRVSVSNSSHRFDRGVHPRLIDRSGLQPAPLRRHSWPPVRVQRIVPVLLIFMKMVDCIHPESIDAPIEPEPEHIAHGLLHIRISPIEVRLLLQVRVVVVLAGHFVESPCRTAKLALPVVGRGTVRLRVSPDIPVPLWMELRGAALLKPRMLVRGVVRHEIKNDP